MRSLAGGKRPHDAARAATERPPRDASPSEKNSIRAAATGGRGWRAAHLVRQLIYLNFKLPWEENDPKPAPKAAGGGKKKK